MEVIRYWYSQLQTPDKLIILPLCPCNSHSLLQGRGCKFQPLIFPFHCPQELVKDGTLQFYPFMSVKIIAKFISPPQNIIEIQAMIPRNTEHFCRRVKSVSRSAQLPNKRLYDFVTCMGNVQRALPNTRVLFCFPLVLCHNLSMCCSVTMTASFIMLYSRTHKLKEKRSNV